MAVTIVGTAKYTPTSSITTRTLTLPTMQVGDTIIVQSVIASGAQTLSLSGVSDLTASGEQTYSGHRHNLWVKNGAVSADSGATLTITTSSALRATVQVVVLRGTGAAPVIDVQAGVNGSASGSTTITSPTVTTVNAADVEFQFIGGSSTAGVTSFTKPAAMTAIATESYDAGTVGGNSYAAIGYNLSQMPATSVPGGDVWTGNSSSLLSAFTVAIKVATAATSARPTAIVASTGWTNVGGAADIVAALADELSTTYAETGDNPNGTQPLNVAVGELTTGNVTVRVGGYANAASPLITRTVALLQGTTVVASRSTTLGTSDTDFAWTTTAGETANITDRTQLRVRVTDAIQ